MKRLVICFKNNLLKKNNKSTCGQKFADKKRAKNLRTKTFEQILADKTCRQKFADKTCGQRLNGYAHYKNFFQGISIVGGRVEVSQKGIEMATTSTLCSSSSTALSSTVSGIFIKSVIADSPAGRCGKLFMGDRLLKVNEIDLLNTTHESAVQAIKNASNPVCFVVQSLQSLQTFVAREKEVGRDLLKEYFQNMFCPLKKSKICKIKKSAKIVRKNFADKKFFADKKKFSFSKIFFRIQRKLH